MPGFFSPSLFSYSGPMAAAYAGARQPAFAGAVKTALQAGKETGIYSPAKSQAPAAQYFRHLGQYQARRVHTLFEKAGAVDGQFKHMALSPVSFAISQAFSPRTPRLPFFSKYQEAVAHIPLRMPIYNTTEALEIFNQSFMQPRFSPLHLGGGYRSLTGRIFSIGAAALFASPYSRMAYPRRTYGPPGTYGRSNNSVLNETGMTPLTASGDVPKCSTALKAWFPQKEARWRQFDDEENAAGYARYLNTIISKFDRLIESGDMQSRLQKRYFYRSMLEDVLTSLEKDAKLRAECFKEAESRMSKCIDNQLVGLYEQEKIISDWTLAKRNLPLAELYRELVPHARRERLHEEAFNLAAAKGKKEESLEYLLNLLAQDPIKRIIPTRNRGAVHAHGFAATPTEAKNIADNILRKEKELGISGHLLTSKAWKAALRRDYPAEYDPRNVAKIQKAQCAEIDRELAEKNTLLEELMDVPSAEQDTKAIDALGQEMRRLIFKKENIESQVWHSVDERLTNNVLKNWGHR